MTSNYPLIRNLKRLDPANPHSPEVIQLETAMGAAIECFKRTSAIEVPRKRFSPVKSTADLFSPSLRCVSHDTGTSA